MFLSKTLARKDFLFFKIRWGKFPNFKLKSLVSIFHEFFWKYLSFEILIYLWSKQNIHTLHITSTIRTLLSHIPHTCKYLFWKLNCLRWLILIKSCSKSRIETNCSNLWTLLYSRWLLISADYVHIKNKYFPLDYMTVIIHSKFKVHWI